MEDYVICDGEKIEYTINKGKRKNIYICISNGKVIIKTPRLVSKFFVSELVKKHAKDILEKVKKQQETKVFNEYQNGKNIKILGKKYKINVVYGENKREKYNIDEKHFNIYLNKFFENNTEQESQEIEKVVNKMYREVAKEEADKLMPVITKKVGLYPKAYTIKKVKTIWGSCSSKKNITLNLDLAKFDQIAMEYVIIHELCHLKYMNHSKNFWAIVEKNMPNYKEVEKILKKQ